MFFLFSLFLDSYQESTFSFSLLTLITISWGYVRCGGITDQSFLIRPLVLKWGRWQKSWCVLCSKDRALQDLNLVFMRLKYLNSWAFFKMLFLLWWLLPQIRAQSLCVALWVEVCKCLCLGKKSCPQPKSELSSITELPGMHVEQWLPRDWIPKRIFSLFWLKENWKLSLAPGHPGCSWLFLALSPQQWSCRAEIPKVLWGLPFGGNQVLWGLTSRAPLTRASYQFLLGFPVFLQEDQGAALCCASPVLCVSSRLGALATATLFQLPSGWSSWTWSRSPGHQYWSASHLIWFSQL